MKEVFIIGGEAVYEEALKFADIMYLTVVQGMYKGDAHFPDFNEYEWAIVAEEPHADFIFLTLSRFENAESSTE